METEDICTFTMVNEEDGNWMERYLNDNNYKFIMADNIPFTDWRVFYM